MLLTMAQWVLLKGSREWVSFLIILSTQWWYLHSFNKAAHKTWHANLEHKTPQNIKKGSAPRRRKHLPCKSQHGIKPSGLILNWTCKTFHRLRLSKAFMYRMGSTSAASWKVHWEAVSQMLQIIFSHCLYLRQLRLLALSHVSVPDSFSDLLHFYTRLGFWELHRS